jgi:transcriptional regulator with XRE-family HTH domain
MDEAAYGTGERIAMARKGRSLTQQQLAGRVPVSLSMLRKVEQGSRDATPALIASVAKALNVSVSTLTGQPYDQHGHHRDRIHAQIPALRRALTYWDLPPSLGTAPRPWVDLAAETDRIAQQRREAAHVAHLRAAMLAARAGDGTTANDHLAEASRISRHLGGLDGDGGRYQLSFGPSNVAIHEVAASVELGDGGAAVRRATALQVTDTGRVPKIRMAQHFVDLSRAQLWIGQRDGALASLHAARNLAPQQTRHHPTTREIVRMLLRAHQRSNEPLARFAGWVGTGL